MPHKSPRKNPSLEDPLIGRRVRPPGYQPEARNELGYYGHSPLSQPQIGSLRNGYASPFYRNVESPRPTRPRSPMFRHSSPKSNSRSNVHSPKYTGQPRFHYSDSTPKNFEDNRKKDRNRNKNKNEVECFPKKSGILQTPERSYYRVNTFTNHEGFRDQPQSNRSKNQMYPYGTNSAIKARDNVTIVEKESKDQLMTNEDKEIMKKFSNEALIEANRKVKKERFEPSEEISQYLSGKQMFPLSVRSNKFSWARWFCRLCDYHYVDLNACWDHLYNSRHLSLMRTRALETTLSCLPKPRSDHLESLELFLNRIVDEHGISEAERSERKKVATNVSDLLKPHIKGCKIQYFGSTLSGFGLKSSDLNLDLSIDKDQQPHLALITSLEVLQQCSNFKNVIDNFSDRVPSIQFETSSGISVSLSLNNHHARQTCLLLADYLALDPRVRIVGIAFRVWAHIVKLDRQIEGGLPPHAFIIMCVFFLQQMEKPVLPCIHDWLDKQKGDNYVRPVEKLAGWRSKNTQSTAELWVDLFSFMSIGLKCDDTIVSLRKMNITIEEKQRKGKRLAVEDPFSHKRSLCKSINSLSMFDYIDNCFKTSSLYFGTIQTSLGPVINEIVPHEEDTFIELGHDWTLTSWLEKKGTKLSYSESVTATSIVPKDMISFNFDQCNLSHGLLPPPSCSSCGDEGHLTPDCPAELQLTLAPLPSLPKSYIRLLDTVCQTSAQEWQPSEQELSDKDYLMADLGKYIKKFWPNAELSLFGSSANGFAFKNSDLDICLTFKGVKTTEDIACTTDLIEELADKIRRMIGVQNVIAVTSAKVPIVKLYHQQCRRDADISLYNVLARENTRMLACYASLDQRVRVLGYMAKLFAKVCDIGDASRGSLSSYAFTLMMIFYLQQCNPPVIPVLQELYPPGQIKPENLVDGWNAWFQDNPKKISSLWPGRGNNKSSVGELWVGYLHYYAGGWDDKRLIVSIKQSRPLTKFEKMWNSHCISIEDPFELGHNLGSGLSRKMNLFIKKTFIKGRTLFGVPFKNNPIGYRRIQDYFFDRSLLTEGSPPNDRNCRICGRVGHLAASCPRRKGDKYDKKRMGNKETKKEEIKVEPEMDLDDKERLNNSELDDSLSEYVGAQVRKEKLLSGDVEDKLSILSKGDREKIKNLEKKRKRQGILTKEESKLLHELKVSFAEMKNGKQLSQQTDVESQNDIKDNNSTDSQNNKTESSLSDRQLKEMINVSIIPDIPTTRAKIVNITYLDDCEDFFNYNELKPNSVVEGTIDYLNPFVLETQVGLEYVKMSEFTGVNLITDASGVNVIIDVDKDLSNLAIADDDLTAYYTADDSIPEVTHDESNLNFSRQDNMIPEVTHDESNYYISGEDNANDDQTNDLVDIVSPSNIEMDIENKLKVLRLTGGSCPDSSEVKSCSTQDLPDRKRELMRLKNERRKIKSKEKIKQKKIQKSSNAGAQ